MELNLTHSVVNQWLERLAESGYRITAPRQAIVEILANSQKALDPITIYDLGRREYPRLGLVTVYRTLEKLEELGLIQRIHQSSGCHMYLRATQGHQHIIICNSCGRVDFFKGDDLSLLFAGVAQHTGFQIQDHWLQLFGVCSQCQQ